jgi:hypothetical protein
VLQRKQQIETRLLDQKPARYCMMKFFPCSTPPCLLTPKAHPPVKLPARINKSRSFLREAPPPPPANIAQNGLFSVIQKTAQTEAELIGASLIFDVPPEVDAAAALLPLEAAETVFYAVGNVCGISRSITTLRKSTGRNCGKGCHQWGAANNHSKQWHAHQYITRFFSGQGLSLHNAC